MSLTGQATIPSLGAASLTLDSADTAPAPSVPAFTTITLLSSPISAPTVITVTNPSNGNGTNGSAAGKNASSKASTGVIIGITVGVFAALAIGLVILMSVRHKRKMARRPKGNRKSWNKLDDGAAGGPGHTATSGRKGITTDVPMRNVVEKNTASPRSPPTGGPIPFQNVKAQSDDAPIAPIMPDHPFSKNVRHVSNNQPDSAASPYTRHPYATNPPQTTQASSQLPKSQNQPGEDGTGGNIPNPFISRSPSNSSAYHSLYNTTSADHDAYASTLSAFPAVQMALRLNSVASSTEYSEDKSPSPTRSHHPDISSTYLDAEHQHGPRESYESLYEQYGSPPQGGMHSPTNPSSPQPRSGAILDIITALDGDRHPPTTWKDSNVNRGSSRLSLGDDQLDPSVTLNRSNDSGLEMNGFPLPPRVNGNNASRNPFRDQV